MWVNGEQLVSAGGSWEPLGQLGSIGYKLGVNETMVGQTVSEWNLMLAYRACWDHDGTNREHLGPNWGQLAQCYSQMGATQFMLGATTTALGTTGSNWDLLEAARSIWDHVGDTVGIN